MFKCVRCNGIGKVRKYIRGECACENCQIYFYICISIVIGGIFSAVSCVLLMKNLLSFDYFGTIFYFLGALSIFSI